MGFIQSDFAETTEFMLNPAERKNLGLFGLACHHIRRLIPLGCSPTDNFTQYTTYGLAPGIHEIQLIVQTQKLLSQDFFLPTYLHFENWTSQFTSGITNHSHQQHVFRFLVFLTLTKHAAILYLCTYVYAWFCRPSFCKPWFCRLYP